MNDTYYIYLVFSKTGTWLSKSINIVSGIKYVHTSICFDESFSEMYSFGRIQYNKPFNGGFAKENLHEGIFLHSSTTECLIYKICVNKEQYFGIYSDVNQFIENKDQYKYNFLGLFGVMFNKPIQRKNYYFCSQFVSELLINHNVYQSDKNPALICSTDLLAIGNKEVLYEGYIKDLFVSSVPSMLSFNAEAS